MKRYLFIQFVLVITLIGVGNATTSDVFANINVQNTVDAITSLSIALEVPTGEFYLTSGKLSPLFYAKEDSAYTFEHQENTLQLSAAYTLTGELPGLTITISSGSLNIHDINYDSDGSCEKIAANKIKCGALTIVRLYWLADSIGNSNSEQIFLSLASLAVPIERDINMSIELPCSHRLNNASPAPISGPEDGIAKWQGNGQVFSVQFELGTLIKLRVKPEEIEQITDGICLRRVDEEKRNIFIGTADLLNPNVRIQLAYDMANEDLGEFWQKPVAQLVQENSGVSDNTTTIDKYYLAINGTGFDSDAFIDGSNTTVSENSILGISKNLYGINGKDKFNPKSNNTSFYAHNTEKGIVKRAGGVDFNLDNAEVTVRNAITSSEFVVGYRRTILDGGYVIGSEDSDPKTAIGINRQGNVLYIATSTADVSVQHLAETLQETGGFRAILLDGGGSPQFNGYSETGKPIDYYAWHYSNPFSGRRVINSIVLYNSENPVSNQQVELRSVQELGAGGFENQHIVQLTPKIKVTLANDSITFVHKPHFPYRVDGLRGMIFFELSALNGNSEPVNLSDAYTLTVDYDGIYLPLDMDENSLALYRLNGSAWERESTSVVNTLEKTVSATTTYLGVWGVFGEAPPPPPTETPSTEEPTATPTVTPTSEEATPTPINQSIYLPSVQR